MRFRYHNRAIVNCPEIIFEELEQRIVLDASVDSTAVDSHAGGPDLFRDLPQGLDPSVSPGAGNAHHPEAGHWNLDYSSDPAVRMAQLLNSDDLASLDVELGTPVPSIQLYAMPTVRDGSSVADLSGAVRISGDPAKIMYLVLTANPRPLTSDGIASLSFSTTTNLDVLVSGSGTQWSLTGPVDSINAILATMQATVNSCFTGFGQIDITLTDEDHSTDITSAPLVDKTLYVPIDRSPFEPAASIPNPQLIPSNVWSALPVSVIDKDSNEVGVILQVRHGTVIVPTDSCDVEGLIAPPITYFGTEGPDGRPLEQGARVGVRGPIPNLQCALSQVQYRSFPGYHGDDQLTVTVTDEAFLPKAPVCTGDIISVTPITVI